MENIHDMMAKNRKPRFPGAKNGRRKLTEAEVLQIIERYRAGESGPSLAAEHGVTRQAIYNIISGQAWAETVAEYQAQRASEVSAEGIRMTPLPTTERRKGKSHHGQAPAPGSLSPRAAAIPGAGTIEQPVGGEQTR